MKLISLAVISGLVIGVSAAFAAEQVINQKGRRFSASQVTVKKGDSLVFVNDDNISQQRFVDHGGNEFNLKSQPPGTSTSVTFDKTGDIKVICAIHPAMQMMVKVTE